MLPPEVLKRRLAPVRLVGYSFGCKVAYWMACKLQAEGHSTELVLLDGFAGGDLAAEREEKLRANIMPKVKSTRRLVRQRAGLTDHEEEAIEANLTDEDMEGIRLFFFDAIDAAGDSKAELAELMVQLTEMSELPDANSVGLPRFEGRVLLVYTEKSNELFPLVKSVHSNIPQVELRVVPGNHFTCISDELAPEIVSAVRDWRASN
eukprot:scaffold223837_cov45-Tisochrysis_lutea.AAC.1